MPAVCDHRACLSVLPHASSVRSSGLPLCPASCQQCAIIGPASLSCLMPGVCDHRACLSVLPHPSRVRGKVSLGMEVNNGSPSSLLTRRVDILQNSLWNYMFTISGDKKLNLFVYISHDIFCSLMRTWVFCIVKNRKSIKILQAAEQACAEVFPYLLSTPCRCRS